MAKIKIWKSIREGFEILIKNPVIFIPAFVMTVLNSLTDILFGSVPEPTETFSQEIMAYLISFMMWFVILTLISIFLTGVIICMVYNAKIKKSFFESVKIATLRYPSLLISGIIYFFIVGFGTLALIIPGIFLFIKLLYYEYAILIDNEGIINSLKKSWKITSGNWLATFFIGVFFLAILFISTILSVGLVTYSADINAKLPFISTILSVRFLPSISNFLDFLTTLVVLPWFTSSLTFAYLQITNRESTASE